MRTLHRTIYYPNRGHIFTLFYLTDLHLGARACDEKLLKRDIAAIAADSSAVWIGGGDYVDGITQVGDKRYKPSTLAPWVLGYDDPMSVQRDYVIKLLSPIADKCAGLICGNHEWAAESWYARTLYWEIVEGIAKAAHTPPEQLGLGAEGFVVLNFRRGTPQAYGGSWACTAYCHHGYGGGRLPGGDALAINRALGDYDCDIGLFGHRHSQAYIPKVVTAPQGRGVVQKTRIGMFVPSYLAAYIIPSTDKKPVDTYAEKIGLPPKHLGTVPVHIRPDTRQLAAVLGNVSGIDMQIVSRRQDDEIALLRVA